ncbi:MAG: glycosyltransferase family 2 protein [Nonlabens sp.]
MKTALLLTTYNWPEALQLLLNSVSRLNPLPDELLIADDGSSNETKTVIDAFIEKKILPVSHIWQEDTGFRRSAILNKTIASCDADYIIQTDGDCILHSRFVADHIKYRKQGRYLHGSRVNFKKEMTAKILKEKNVVASFFNAGIKKRMRAVHLPVLASLNKEEEYLSSKVRGCNLSYWRNDFIRVNGYNEDIEGWGREDSELILRFLNNGIKGKRLKFAAIIFHLWHKIQDKGNLTRNTELEEKTRKLKIKKVSNGVSKYLKTQL